MQYQKMNFNGKLYFDGIDREPDYNIIFPESPKNKTILDIGCNIGYYSIKSALEGAKFVTGVDNHNIFINYAKLIKNDLNLSNVKFLCDTIENFKELKYDYVLCLNILHHFNNIDNVIQKIINMANELIVFQVLRPDKNDPIIIRKKNKIGNHKIYIKPEYFKKLLPTWKMEVNISRVNQERDIIKLWR